MANWHVDIDLAPDDKLSSRPFLFWRFKGVGDLLGFMHI
jgi:hypothetical protein